MIMVGYSGYGYRMWDPVENKIVNARDVIFDEYNMKYKQNKSGANGSH